MSQRCSLTLVIKTIKTSTTAWFFAICYQWQAKLSFTD